MKRREDGAVREVMKRLLRSDLRFHKTDCGRFGAMTAWGLKDTSSRPAKDLGGNPAAHDTNDAAELWQPRQRRPVIIPVNRLDYADFCKGLKGMKSQQTLIN